MNAAMSVSVQTEDFDVSRELARLREGNTRIGAVVSFIGTVRDISGDEPVSMMSLEHYPGMTEAQLADIITEAKKRWPVFAARIVHRVSVLYPTDQIVLVAVAAGHRGEAFAACEFIMDCLKTQAPFWKSETTPSGTCWVDAKESDSKAAQRWQQEGSQ
jgi:molybdopterin synthase catalytic subunit